jgi:hypothetical protein
MQEDGEGGASSKTKKQAKDTAKEETGQDGDKRQRQDPRFKKLLIFLEKLARHHSFMCLLL